LFIATESTIMPIPQIETLTNETQYSTSIYTDDDSNDEDRMSLDEDYDDSVSVDKADLDGGSNFNDVTSHQINPAVDTYNMYAVPVENCLKNGYKLIIRSQYKDGKPLKLVSDGLLSGLTHSCILTQTLDVKVQAQLEVDNGMLQKILSKEMQKKNVYAWFIKGHLLEGTKANITELDGIISNIEGNETVKPQDRVKMLSILQFRKVEMYFNSTDYGSSTEINQAIDSEMSYRNPPLMSDSSLSLASLESTEDDVSVILDVLDVSLAYAEDNLSALVAKAITLLVLIKGNLDETIDVYDLKKVFEPLLKFMMKAPEGHHAYPTVYECLAYGYLLAREGTGHCFITKRC